MGGGRHQGGQIFQQIRCGPMQILQPQQQRRPGRQAGNQRDHGFHPAPVALLIAHGFVFGALFLRLSQVQQIVQMQPFIALYQSRSDRFIGGLCTLIIVRVGTSPKRLRSMTRIASCPSPTPKSNTWPPWL